MDKENEMEWISECCGSPPDEFFSLNFHFPAKPIGLCGDCKEHTSFDYEGDDDEKE